jgi:hypothetical protein
MSVSRRTALLSLSLALAPSLVPLGALAAEPNARIGGVQFDARAQVGGQPLLLNGTGLRAVAWIKGYAAGLYLGQRAGSPDQVVALDGPKRLQMRMLLDVPVAEFIKAFHKGVDRNTPEDQHAKLAERMSQFDQLIQPLGKVKVGDTVNLDYLPNQGMVFSHNGRQVGAAIPGADFYSALLLVFIGQKPVDDKLKLGLLGQAA